MNNSNSDLLSLIFELNKNVTELQKQIDILKAKIEDQQVTFSFSYILFTLQSSDTTRAVVPHFHSYI